MIYLWFTYATYDLLIQWMSNLCCLWFTYDLLILLMIYLWFTYPFEHLLILLMNYLVYLRQSSAEAAFGPNFVLFIDKSIKPQGTAAYGPTAIAGCQETTSSHPRRLAVILIHDILALSDTCKWQVLEIAALTCWKPVPIRDISLWFVMSCLNLQWTRWL